jgi:hypothetical protein
MFVFQNNFSQQFQLTMNEINHLSAISQGVLFFLQHGYRVTPRSETNPCCWDGAGQVKRSAK